MSKKTKDKIPTGDEQNEPIEIPEPISEVTPSIIGATKEVPLRIGYVFAKLIGKDSQPIQIPAKYVGTIYPTDKWEILSDKKKL